MSAADAESLPNEDGRREVLLVDSHILTRQCLSSLLRGKAPDLVIRETSGFEEWDPSDSGALGAVFLRISDCDGSLEDQLSAISARNEVPANVPIVVLGGCDDMETALLAVSHGARCYLSSGLGVDEVIAALRLAMAGGIYMWPAPTRGATEPTGPVQETLPAPAAPDLDGAASVALTAREAEVMWHLRQGKQNKAIAFEMALSENTVKIHVSRILRKIGAKNRTGAALLR